MNTKEAISHIEAAIDCRAFIEIKPEHYATYKKAMLEIIEMLKRFEKFEQIMIIKDNRCIIQYKGKDRILKFEKELIKLFKDNGFKFIGSGFDMCDRVRDLCFERIIKEGQKEKLKEELIGQSKETAKLNLEICKEFEHTGPK